jgi:hypothetical protein
MSAASRKAAYRNATVPDWAAVAADAWEVPSWKAAAREYHQARDRSGDKPDQQERSPPAEDEQPCP